MLEHARLSACVCMYLSMHQCGCACDKDRERKRVRLTLEHLNGQESDWKDQVGGSKKVCLMKGEKM